MSFPPLRCPTGPASRRGLMHRQEAAGRLVDVHDAVCAGSVLVHEPAELDEEPVRVGVLLRAVDLFHALGGLLEAQAHATQELLHPGEKAQKYFNRKGINEAVCLASACYISRLLPSVSALQGPGRRCTSAASRANPCKTAPASCRRPGTRTGQRRGRHPTPGDPALWTRAKTKAEIRAKGTTERAIHRTKEKRRPQPKKKSIPITVFI